MVPLYQVNVPKSKAKTLSETEIALEQKCMRQKNDTTSFRDERIKSPIPTSAYTKCHIKSPKNQKTPVNQTTQPGVNKNIENASRTQTSLNQKSLCLTGKTGCAGR